jgi:C-terminal processing protease CtpA/Prc
MGWNLTPKEPRIEGKVIFLIDSSAISYSESFLSFVEHYKLGKLLGQPTAGTNGNVNVFSLPGGYSVSWTGMKVVKHNGSQHYLIGIRPDIWVYRTIEGVKQNRDEFLEKALEVMAK